MSDGYAKYREEVERVCAPCGKRARGECDSYCHVAMALDKAGKA